MTRPIRGGSPFRVGRRRPLVIQPQASPDAPLGILECVVTQKCRYESEKSRFPGPAKVVLVPVPGAVRLFLERNLSE